MPSIRVHRYFAAEIRAWLIANGAEHVEARALAIEKVARELLQIVVIDLTVDENAQEIFETLNARGTPLTAADLIKNFIFQRLMEGKENVEAIYERQWQDFETAFWETEISAGRIRHSRSSIFLGHFLIARTGEEIVDREVFTRFKRFADHEAGVPMAQLVTQLRRAATVYRSFIDLSSSTDEALGGLGLFAYRANVMESEVVKPLVMWLQDPEQAAIAEIQILESLAVVESWLVRRMLVRSTTKNYNQVFASLIMELGKNDRINVAQQIEEFFVHQQAESAYWPDDEEVRHELSTSPLYRRLQRPRLRMVLEAIEDHRRGWRGTVEGLGGQRARRSKYEIEHVMPQSWEQHWPAGPNPDNENERHQLIHTLGNLTLLTGKLNAKVSNGPWETKLAALREHDVLKLTQDVRIVGEDGWNGDVIRNRTAGMIDDIIAIWPVPAGHQSPTSTPSSQRKVAVTISDLINSGLLAAGATLTPRRKALRHRTAIVLADGRLEVDSVIYDSPSGAAKGITTKQENGWWFFLADAEHGVSLSDVLRQYIDFTSADADENSDETELSE